MGKIAWLLVFLVLVSSVSAPLDTEETERVIDENDSQDRLTEEEKEFIEERIKEEIREDEQIKERLQDATPEEREQIKEEIKDRIEDEVREEIIDRRREQRKDEFFRMEERKKDEHEIRSDIRIKDLNKRNLKRLGIKEEEIEKAKRIRDEAIRLRKEGKIDEARAKIREVNEILPQIKVKKDVVKKLKQKQHFDKIRDHPKAKKFIKKQIKRHYEVRIRTEQFDISKNDAKVDKSRVSLILNATDDEIEAGELLVVIPKEIAESIDNVTFSEDPEILEDDPVVKWAFKNIPQGEYKEYSYTVDKDVQTFETLVEAITEEDVEEETEEEKPKPKKSFLQKIVEFFANLFK